MAWDRQENLGMNPKGPRGHQSHPQLFMGKKNRIIFIFEGSFSSFFEGGMLGLGGKLNWNAGIEDSKEIKREKNSF